MRFCARRVFCLVETTINSCSCMKTNTVRYVLLAWLIGSILTMMAVPFLSFNSQVGVAEGFRSMLRPLFLFSILLLGWLCIGDNVIDFWRIRRSRNECRKAYRLLYRHFNEYPLEGFETSTCQHLQQNLQSELKRHCSQYPFERHHKTVKWYMKYSRQIATTRSVA